VVNQFKQVSLEDHNGNCFLADVILTNPFEDIAFLKTAEGFDVPHLPLHTTMQINRGDKVYVAGFPFGMPFTVTEGVISAPNQLMGERNYIQTDAAVNPGNSGGPILNASGEVIGITTSKFNNADNMGFAVPVSTLTKAFESLPNIKENSTNLVCYSCSALIHEKSEYCNNCGHTIDVKFFNEPVLTDLAMFCEQAISELGVNPVIARKSYESWQLNVGSALVRLFVYNHDYLYATSPINQLPSQNMAALLEELVSKEVTPYKLGIHDKEIFVSYRVHISDVFSKQNAEIKKNLTGLFSKANELDDYFQEKFGCKYSVHSLKSKNVSA